MKNGESTTINIAETSRKGPVIAAPVSPKGGNKKGIAIFDFILRLGAIAATLAACVTMGTADQTLPFFTQFFQFQAGYDDLPTFQFFVIATAIVCSYLVLSLPFSIVCVVRPNAVGPRLLLIICDIVITGLITAAASSATAIVYLAHTGSPSANWNPICQQFTDFCQSVSGAVVGSFVAVVAFMFLLFFSALALQKH